MLSASCLSVCLDLPSPEKGEGAEASQAVCIGLGEHAMDHVA